jgi:hypothetical protein
MLSLFKSLFGDDHPAAGRYPEQVIEEGMALARDATDARIRSVPGHESMLRKAVLACFDHVVALVDTLPPVQDLTRESYAALPQIAAFFSSAQHIQQVIRDDAVLGDWFAGPEGRGASEVHALLLMQRSEHKTLGMELQGEIVRREVAQVAVNFGAHRFLAPAESAEASLKQLYRRAYNHILELALGRMIAERGERADLKQQRKLLEQKLHTLDEGQWALGGEARSPLAPDTTEQQIERLDRQLQGMGADEDLLERHLGILCDVLQHPGDQLWAETVHLVIDRMGIKRDSAGGNNLDLSLQELHGARGGSVVVQRVRIPRLDFPVRGDFLAEAERLLR